jgi:hypothetical protein
MKRPVTTARALAHSARCRHTKETQNEQSNSVTYQVLNIKKLVEIVVTKVKDTSESAHRIPSMTHIGGGRQPQQHHVLHQVVRMLEVQKAEVLHV